MIKVTDLGGNLKFINCELIERIELIPDTLLVLVNGQSFIVRDTPEQVIEKIVSYKKQIDAGHRVTYIEKADEEVSLDNEE